MNKLDVLVICHYSGAGPQSNNRFRELAGLLSGVGASVELVTSSFQHGSKKPRDVTLDIESDFPITYIDEPGYIKNLSIRRFYSHYRMARNLKVYLNKRQVPDVIYCAIPSNSVGAVAAQFAQENGVRLIVDVQDLWPEAFEIAIKPRWLAKFVFTPMRRQANRIYALSNRVVTVSQTYSKRVLEGRMSSEKVDTVYLGTHLENFDKHLPIPFEKELQEINLVYIGTLGHNYDLPLVFNALRMLNDAPIRISLHIMGTGPLEEKWRLASSDLSDRVHFHGRLPYSEMVSRMKSCDIAINPIVPGAAGSIINKVCDYAAGALPVINTQDSVEYQELLREFHAGINCISQPDALAEAIYKLAGDTKTREVYSRGARLMAETHFDRAKTYQTLMQLVLNNE